jgi:hypothetical protein
MTTAVKNKTSLDIECAKQKQQIAAELKVLDVIIRRNTKRVDSLRNSQFETLYKDVHVKRLNDSIENDEKLIEELSFKLHCLESKSGCGYDDFVTEHNDCSERSEILHSQPKKQSNKAKPASRGGNKIKFRKRK